MRLNWTKIPVVLIAISFLSVPALSAHHAPPQATEEERREHRARHLEAVEKRLADGLAGLGHLENQAGSGQKPVVEPSPLR